MRLRGYAATRLRGYAAARLRGYAATRLRGYAAPLLCCYAANGDAAARRRGDAATLSDNPTVNYARVMLATRHCHCRRRFVALVDTAVAPHGSVERCV